MDKVPSLFILKHLFKSEALYVGSMRTREPGSMGIILLAVITTLTNKLLTIIKQSPTVGLLWIKKPFLIHYLIWGNGRLSHSCWHCEESMHSVPDQRRVFPSQPLGVSRKWIAQGIGLATPENKEGGEGMKGRIRTWYCYVRQFFLPLRILTAPLGCKRLDGCSDGLWTPYCVET